MRFRFLATLALVLLTASCGGLGDSSFGDSFGDSLGGRRSAPPAPPPPSSLDPADDTDAADDEAAALDAPEAEPPARPVEIDPANTEALESERVICEEKGGRWSRSANSSGYACVLTTRDANKQCKSGSDCQGYCLARSRTCAPVVPLFGCHEVLSAAGATQRICIE